MISTAILIVGVAMGSACFGAVLMGIVAAARDDAKNAGPVADDVS